MIKPVAIIKVVSKPIGHYRGMKILKARRHFKDFCGSSHYDDVIVVSPKFLKLDKSTQQLVLEHEYQECLYFTKGAKQLGQRAHEYACRVTGFPDDQFCIRCGKKPRGLIPW
jgi:hypothetical protein